MTELTITSGNGRRQFALFPVAILVFVVDADDRVLFLRKQGQEGWGVPSGGMEAGETVVAGALRELREEAGPEFQVRPIGIAHVYSVAFDAQVSEMISICYVLSHESGDPAPGSDATGGEFRWFTLDEIESDAIHLNGPYRQPWIVRRAIESHRIWCDDDVPLQPVHGPVSHLAR